MGAIFYSSPFQATVRWWEKCLEEVGQTPDLWTDQEDLPSIQVLLPLQPEGIIQPGYQYTSAPAWLTPFCVAS